MKRDVEALKKIVKNHKILSPYIKYIRFPYIKNLKPNLKIEFTFPITALVGQNGTNKSTILRCLFGCPENYNTATYWFSTRVDPIDESNGRARYIYGYYQEDAKRDVEVLKTRIKRKNRLDEWETSRPLMSDGMEKMPPLEKDEEGNPILKGRKKTRWLPIDKKVAFLDFRSELSAYDKFIYFREFKRTKTLNFRQDYIRKQSKHLQKIIQEGLQEHNFYGSNCVAENYSIPDNQVKYISNILGKEYSKINIIKHVLFKGARSKSESESNDISVVLYNKNIRYSEAFAGSGEFSVVMLVETICSLPEKSLILLDEPEVSLHPGAQRRLLEFLVQQVKERKHQIVFGTHSPYMVRGLPPNAIKTLFVDPVDNKIDLTNFTIEDEAFFHLGVPVSDKILVLVEDRLAKELVEKALRTLGEALHTRFLVKPVPGGAQALLLSYLPLFAKSIESDTKPLFIIDGDMNKNIRIPPREELDKSSGDDLHKLAEEALGGKLNVPVDGHDGKPDQKQRRSITIDALCYFRDYAYFLPCSTPESFILTSCDIDYPVGKEKDFFVDHTKKLLGKSFYEDVGSDEIFETQRRMLAGISGSNKDIVGLANWISSHISKDN
ncbi:MAG: ATP-binding protein [Candidatus Electrothrix sp. ATG2]|nr:ATP-binding protein [Candidatus Electrothrix sp. ATG2]